MNKLSHGIKVAKQGYNVIAIENDRIESSIKKSPSHLLLSLALPYLLGAKSQVKRYQEAALTLQRRPVWGVYDCLHEISTLFEDLCTVSKYIEKCGKKKEIHKLWFDIRNHIRHDIREEFDREDDSRKNKRLQNLKIDPKLQTSIGFAVDSIKIGEIIIKINQIETYLKWAENIISNVMNEAKRRGDIK